MRFIVQDSLKVKTLQGERTVNPGQIISLSEGKAERLIAVGKIMPINTSVALPENLKETDGGPSWCKTVCMLPFPSQWSMCERFKPCIKLEGTN